MSEAIAYLFDILEIAAGYALATTSSDCHVHCRELAMTIEKQSLYRNDAVYI